MNYCEKLGEYRRQEGKNIPSQYFVKRIMFFLLKKTRIRENEGKKKLQAF